MNKLSSLGLGVSLLLVCTWANGYGANLLLKLKGTNKGFCMDASLDEREKDGDKVYAYKCTGRENQRWALTHDTNGQSVLVGLGGYCLDVRGTRSTGSGTPVELWQCHYGKNQRFTVSPNGQLKEVESGKCLIAKGETDRAPIVLDTCTNSTMEQWEAAQQ